LVFNQACTKDPKIVWKTKNIYIPVMCVTPKVICDINKSSNNIETLGYILQCVYDLKEAAKVCNNVK
jgi:hypothetical protein